LLRCGDDIVSDDADCMPPRLEVLLVVLRAAGRDFGVVVRGREVVDFGFAVVAFGFDLEADRELLDFALEDVVLPAVDEVLRVLDLVDLGLAADLDDVDLDDEAAFAGLAEDIVLAAVLSALAALVMALVAVFIARIADDIVFADAVALVAAAVIFVAADVTLVAAVETPLAAVAGVVELRLDELRVERDVVDRVEVRRAAVGRDALDRDVRDPEAVEREPAELLVVVLLVVLRAERAALLRVDREPVLEVLEPDLVLGRLAVPPDALRLADLLRAVLAELRRLAARVVD